MRLPHFLNLATSKTKQFCETPSIFEVDNIKNEAILRDILQKWKVECTNALCDFPLHLSKVLRLPRKSEAGSYKVLHLSRKITSGNLKISYSKMQPLLGNLCPDLLTSLMNMSLVFSCTAPATRNAFFIIIPHPLQMSQTYPDLPSLLDMLQNPPVFCSLLVRCGIPCACHAKPHLNHQKRSEHVVLLTC